MKEIIIFAMVGITATIIHYFIAIIGVESLGAHPLFANFLAYIVAVFVSYAGHTVFTFNSKFSRKTSAKFLAVSVSALFLSQLLLALLVYLEWFTHRVNFLFIVFSIPAYSYLLNKFWVYQKTSL